MPHKAVERKRDVPVRFRLLFACLANNTGRFFTSAVIGEVPQPVLGLTDHLGREREGEDGDTKYQVSF